MLKIRPRLNLLECSEHTRTSLDFKCYQNFRRYSACSKENNNGPIIKTKKNSKNLKISIFNNQEGTTAQEDSITKLSNSQNITKQKKSIKKSVSMKNKKKERIKLIKYLRNNEKVKIPNCKRKSNAEAGLKLNINNIDKLIKNHSKERSDSFGNKITKDNKKNVHICFQSNNSKKKFIELIPIESFKRFNITENNQNKIAKPYISKCCAIF